MAASAAGADNKVGRIWLAAGSSEPPARERLTEG
jgi:hypothetical protein